MINWKKHETRFGSVVLKGTVAVNESGLLIGGVMSVNPPIKKDRPWVANIEGKDVFKSFATDKEAREWVEKQLHMGEKLEA